MRSKIFKLVLSASLVSALITTSTVFAQGKPNSHISGVAAKKIVAHYDNVDTKTISKLIDISNLDSNVKVLVDSNNSVDITTIIPAKQGMVFVNGKEAKVDRNGKYSIDIDSAYANVELKLKNKSIKSKNVKIADKNDVNIDIVDTIPFSTFIQTMDNESVQAQNTINSSVTTLTTSTTTTTSSTSYPGQSNGQPVYWGDHVHCNRLNGTNSDHYYWTYLNPIAYIDFYGSDCYYDLVAWGCDSPGADTECDGLNVYGNGVYDCSLYSGWPPVAWFRN